MLLLPSPADRARHLIGSLAAHLDAATLAAVDERIQGLIATAERDAFELALVCASGIGGVAPAAPAATDPVPRSSPWAGVVVPMGGEGGPPFAEGPGGEVVFGRR